MNKGDPEEVARELANLQIVPLADSSLGVSFHI